MKILTNVQTSHLGGIGQSLSNFIDYLGEKKELKAQVVGVDIISKLEESSELFAQGPHNFRLIRRECRLPEFGKTVRRAEKVSQIEESYQEVVDKYLTIIDEEKPGIILLNGTYYLPWCLFLAGRQRRVPMVLHYHGILSKELRDWPEREWNKVLSMERLFDNDSLFFLFPSRLARKTVEKEVFGHKISKSAVVRNPVPEHFFDIKKRGSRKKVGVVGRWSAVKNPEFLSRFCYYVDKKELPYEINLVTKGAGAEELARERKRVRLVKPMANFELAKFYEEMGVVISPSTFETYGNVAQEALATGTPALVSANMGIAEVYKKLGLEEWVIDFGEVSAVVKKVREAGKMRVDNRVRQALRETLSCQTISRKMAGILWKV